MIKVSAQHEYAADVDTVFALFSKPEFYEEKFRAVGARHVEVREFTADGPALTFSIDREMPAAAPAVIQSIIGEWNMLTQHEQWGGEPGEEYWNEFEIKAHGTPVRINGSMLLRGQGDGCVNEVELEIRCGIPLLGKQVERFVASDAEASLEAEYRFITEQLA